MQGLEVCHSHSGAKVGRPPALTPEVHRRIVQLVKAGCSGEIAAQAAGISATTYYEIRRRGREEEAGPERELCEALDQARAEAYAHAMGHWRREMATPGNWRANVAYIDRFDRGRFRSGDEPGGASGERGGPAHASEQRLDLSALGDEQIAYLEDLYAGEGSDEGEER